MVEETVSCAFTPGAPLSPPGFSSTQSQDTFSALNSKLFGMGDQKKKKAQRGASEVSMRREIVHLYSLPITP